MVEKYSFIALLLLSNNEDSILQGIEQYNNHDRNAGLLKDCLERRIDSELSSAFTFYQSGSQSFVFRNLHLSYRTVSRMIGGSYPIEQVQETYKIGREIVMSFIGEGVYYSVAGRDRFVEDIISSLPTQDQSAKEEIEVKKEESKMDIIHRVSMKRLGEVQLEEEIEDTLEWIEKRRKARAKSR